MSMAKKRIAFLCVHNSCRSQMAEALGRHLAGDRFEFYSAGTETKPRINQDAVRLMKQVYGIDMEKEQYSKTIDKIPTPDLVISMGCDVGCPYIGRALTTTGSCRPHRPERPGLSGRHPPDSQPGGGTYQ